MEQGQINKLTRSKTASKLDLTRLCSSVETDLASLTKYMIKEILCQLRDAFRTYNDATNLLAAELATTEDVDPIVKKYYKCISLLEEKLESLLTPPTSSTTSEISSVPNLNVPSPSSQITQNATTKQRTVKLPELRINNFSGKLKSPESQTADENLSQIVQKFWESEEVNPPISESVENHPSELLFLNTVKILPSGRYQVNLNLKHSVDDLHMGNSFITAKKRFFHLEKKLHSDPVLLQSYSKIIQDYHSQGLVSDVPLQVRNFDGKFNYFLPHFPIIKTSSTTPVRIVFDPNNKSTSGICLNQVLDKGFTVQPELFDILITFRHYTYILAADIKHMFLQISINEQETFLLNFLWRDKQDDKLQCFRFNRLPFGLSSSPFLATRVLKHIADTHAISHPSAAKTLLNSTYMDDVLSGGNNLEEIETLHFQLSSLLSKHGFQLHKLSSNHPEFLKKRKLIPTPEIKLSLAGSSDKILGIIWSPDQDTFSFKPPVCEVTSPITKRKILSYVSRLFDPLGLLSPTLVYSKLLLQRIWSLSLDWDTPITNDKILSDWQSLLTKFQSINLTKFPRCLVLDKKVILTQLITFCDASQDIYAACVYLRVTYDDSTVSVRLVTSKTKIAPLKNKLTIPRLELSAILLGIQLTHRSQGILQKDLKISETHLFSDSTIALTWVTTSKFLYNQFVQSRVIKIRSLSESYQFHHVESKQNPADLPSRAKSICSNAELTDLWLHGPKFLIKPEIDYSLFQIKKWNGELPELRKNQVSLNVTVTAQSNDTLDDLFNRCSSFTKIQRSLAYVLRFVSNLKAKSNHTAIDTDVLSVEEIEFSTCLVLKKKRNKLLNIICEKYLSYLARHVAADFGLRLTDTALNTSMIASTEITDAVERIAYMERHKAKHVTKIYQAR
ncbi:uncharacterized protein LOC126881745 [Diabrotica virgifera virgifera]|uniref:Reverse transcriptase domain-containing protein n=1 Tax=Diabrotica virgifera virgifera TaxID=50390 RepID=A0ABM5JW60_DIAVI|nr:uncharacterized protein LOC126881745 [Diabrotica virgifera virgifera]